MEEIYKINSSKATNILRAVKFLVASASVFVLFGLSGTAQSASMFFSPASGSYRVGNILTTSIYVSSADQAMNALSGVITFPTDKLEVVSLSKSGSIMSLWVREPSFSNSAGTINLEGVVLNPGFTGSSGRVITINFRTKAEGSASLVFTSGQVLANDGKGTNILTGLGSANFSLQKIAAPPPPTPTPAPKPTPLAPPGTPVPPQIFSPTHPDSNKWYTDDDVRFTWDLPSDVTSVRLLVGKIPEAIPDPIPSEEYVPPVSSKTLTNLEDGSWYFHVSLKNKAGWGNAAHYRFQIDNKKPTRFDITEVERWDKTKPKIEFVFDAEDAAAGVDYYEVQIDGGDLQKWQDDGSGIYETPTALGPGRHRLVAKAVDKAGHSLTSSVEFEIAALEGPVLLDYPTKLEKGETLLVKGMAKPNSSVVVWLQRGKDKARNWIAESDAEGSFTFITDDLKVGVYKLWAEVVDSRGARSHPTDKMTLPVERPAILKIGDRAITMLMVVVPLVALIILLLLIIWYGWHKFVIFRRSIRKEVREAEAALYRAFVILRKDVQDHIKLLEKTERKRELTKEEIRIIVRLKENLDKAEKIVNKEIGDIDRKVSQVRRCRR